MPKLYAIISYLLILFQTQVFGQFLLTTPIPRSTSDSITNYPCGPNAFGTGTLTTIAPGNYTVVWTETVDHTGAPYVIVLSCNDDNHPLVLIDNIPHNPAPAPKKYAFDIVIPDINCNQCALQMFSPMVDIIPNGTSCTYPTGINVCPSVYHSCADIKINGKNSVDSFVNGYNYTNPSCWENSTPGVYSEISAVYTIDSNQVYHLDYLSSFGCQQSVPVYNYPPSNNIGSILASIFVPIGIVCVAFIIFFFDEKRHQKKNQKKWEKN